MKFSQTTIEAINYYVYCLKDPRTKEIFYIGKGKENRVFEHVEEALKDEERESAKIDLIREIKDEGLEVEHYIIRYGLEESVALEVEAALIDCLGLENLANKVKGHHTERGKISCEELEIQMGAKEASIEDDVLVIKINQLYRRGMTEGELYEATRKYWRLSKKNAKNIQYVLAVANGIIRGIFKPKKWVEDIRPESEGKAPRIAFIGEVAPKEIYEKYIGKTVNSYPKTQGQNPTVYLFGAPTHTHNERIELEEKLNEELKEEKGVEEITAIAEKVITIKINQEYRAGMSKEELYKVTQYCWYLSLDKAKKAKYVFAIAEGEVKEIYSDLHWYRVEERERIAFTGKVEEGSIRDKYIGKSVKKLYKQGEANPCKYFNI